MSVATLTALTSSPHMHSASSSSHSSMDNRKANIKSEESSKKHTRSHAGEKTTPPRSNIAPAAKQSSDPSDNKHLDGTSNEVTQPLAPPPRPAPIQPNGNDPLDYFSTGHTTNSHFSREPNPFEQSFGNPSSETPGAKSLLPPVAAITSPAPLEGPSAGGYGGWGGSLRSGPLSPAMLGGPVGAGATDYFDSSLRGTTFPSGVTPNESSLRTGLTPGGGGSMFPAPSPNSQALFQQLASGGATPSTLDFHRTAMSAAAIRKGQFAAGNTTSQADNKAGNTSVMDPALQQQVQQPTFGQHDNDAANGLFLLAQASNGPQQSSQYSVPSAANTSNNQAGSQETSPTMTHNTAQNGSLNGSAQGSGDLSDSGDQGKPATRSRGKRTSSGRAVAATNGRRKAEEAAAKQPASKKAKTSTSNINIDMDGMDSDDEQPNIKEEQYHENGRKMTDEEKRKNFLERNRVAALKCRQRKKQWLANLQAKVEIFSSENDSLSAQVSSLREEIVTLKSILLQHKDCPVSQSQGLGPFFQQQQQDFNHHANPYGMGIQNGQQVMAGQRR